ncbi:MAG: M20/M25/M40 family metallo-hydrolase [Verrucomicrobia bacterium]|nr:M20/M25/M40 family metallo-hydrolase [Verrucomicrobiota bacterium]MDA1065762.1 M20/M25/M40 family metallo-hydrolase [Verrucomicrobiota bacterium]
MILDPLTILKDLIRFPSVSADSAFKQGLADTRDYLERQLKTIGFDVEIIKTTGHPIILAEHLVEPEAPKVVIYGHYDVQPPDPIDLWKSAPFEPEIRGDRIYGRGAADNKGPVSVYLSVLSELLDERPDLRLNIVIILEGEEEIGSPSFMHALEPYAARVTGDFVFACDSGSLRPDQLSVTTGLRGISCLEVSLEGASKDLHSGLYGGAIMNPIHALTNLCQSLHNSDGTINIPGFYDSIEGIEQWERDELVRAEENLDDLKTFLGVNEFYTVPGLNASEAPRLAPTLEFNGIGGGYQGKGSKTVIPSKAFVKISCRLVANQNPDRIQELLMETIKERCPKQMRLSFEIEHNGNPYLVVPPGKPNTPADMNPVLAKAFESTEKHGAALFGKKPVYLREGGSIPIISDIKKVFGMDTLLVGLYLPEDGMHAPNESFSLTMMTKGKKLIKNILSDIAD